MKTFIVGIPLFDTEMKVQAYRLICRSSERLLGQVGDFRELEDALHSPGLELIEKIGTEPFAGDCPLFVDVNEYHLLMDVPLSMNISPERIVCVLPEDVSESEKIIKKCEKLKENGYHLAWGGIPFGAAKSPYEPLFEYFMVNYEDEDFVNQVKSITPILDRRKIIITQIPNVETYETLRKVPGCYYTGQFYSQPITRGVTFISPIKINALQLLNQVNQEDFDLTDIAATIGRDPSLSIALLRFINSVRGRTKKINSLKNAVAILGQKEVKRWATVAISMSLAKDRPGEITKLSLVRAKFAENLAVAFENGSLEPSLFMAGLFSLIDVILEKPMEEAIEEVAIDEKVKKALLEKKGEIYDVLELVYAYEKADWDKVSIIMIRHQIAATRITEAFVAALTWYKELLDDIDDTSSEPEETDKTN